MSEISSYKWLYHNLPSDLKIQSEYTCVQTMPYGYERLGYRLLIPPDWGKQTGFSQPTFEPGKLTTLGLFTSPDVGISRRMVAVNVINAPYLISWQDWLGWYAWQIGATIIEQGNGVVAGNQYLDLLLEVPDNNGPFSVRIRALPDATELFILEAIAWKSDFDQMAQVLETAAVSFELTQRLGGEAEQVQELDQDGAGVRFNYPVSWQLRCGQTHRQDSACIWLQAFEGDGLTGHLGVFSMPVLESGISDPHGMSSRFCELWLAQGYVVEEMTPLENTGSGWQEYTTSLMVKGVQNELRSALKQEGQCWLAVSMIAPYAVDNPPGWMRVKRTYEIVRDSLRRE
jgi:hypothetical protein